LEFQKLEWYIELLHKNLWSQFCTFVRVGLQQVTTKGTKDGLKYLIDRSKEWNDNSFYISVLAQSASILITAHYSLIGNPGMIIQLDQLNTKTGVKETNILHCQRLESS
jgi:hypothetical protein